MALPGIFLLVVGAGEDVALSGADEFDSCVAFVTVGIGAVVAVVVLLLAEVCNTNNTTRIMQKIAWNLIPAIVKSTSLFLPLYFFCFQLLVIYKTVLRPLLQVILMPFYGFMQICSNFVQSEFLSENLIRELSPVRRASIAKTIEVRQ